VINKKFQFGGLVIGLTAFPFSLNAATSLHKALSSTYQTSNSLMAAKYEKAAAEGLNIRSFSEFLPSVRFDTAKNFLNDKTYANGYSTNKNTSSESFVISQNLFNGGRSLATIKSNNAQIAAKLAEYIEVEQKTISEGIKAYLDVWTKQANLKVGEKAERVYKETLEMTREKEKFGVASQADVERATAEYQRINSGLAQRRAELANALAAYLNTVGMAVDQLEDPVMLINMPASEDEVLKMAMVNNPSLIKQDKHVDEAEGRDLLSKANFLPTVTLDASVGRERSITKAFDQRTANSKAFSRSLTATLSVPIFQKGAEYATLKEASNTLSATKEKLRGRQQDIVQACQSTWAGWQSAIDQVNNNSARVKSAAFLKESVRQEYNFGLKTLFDVFQAERDLLDAEYALIEAQSLEFSNAYQIINLMGNLTARNLKLEEETLTTSRDNVSPETLQSSNTNS
jgi:outer membrane protein